ncbi:hypothetical protein EUX98_g460 [Antrodiella citrinella]|uniref:Uncharacterized protein n=1 Tax=Antrodiella citrinella TaxID=2447956 RepID=A0A4S4NCR4_9APHY|nr:hypothetical protein EUX98_g460 [Antrodiella citrinella]
MSSSANVSGGKKDENRRTLTDFKILALEIRDIGWSWGALPTVKSEVKEVKEEPSAVEVPPPSEGVPLGDQSSTDSTASQPPPPDATSEALQTPSASMSVSEEVPAKSESVAPVIPPPPSRIRIYFHTPVTADDAQPLTAQSSFAQGSSESGVRKGKRKKLDDDGDLEDGRGPPPPPPGVDHDSASISASVDYDGSETVAGRDSVAPSVASEGDWLMAAINDDVVEGEDEDTLHVDEHLREDDGGGAVDDDAEGEHYDSHDGMQIGDEPAQSSTVTGDAQFEDDAMPPGVESKEIPDRPLESSHWQEGASQASHSLSASGELDESKAEPFHGDDAVMSAQFSQEASEDTSSQVASEHEPAVPEAFTEPIKVDDVSDRTAHLQVSSQPETSGLKREDSTVTIPDTNGTSSPYASTAFIDEDQQNPAELHLEPTQMDDSQGDYEHDPASDTHPMGPPPPPAASETTKERMPSANRLSISYAAGTRRMVIDAEIVDKLRVNRGEARIEVFLTIDKEGDNLKGITVEEFTEASTSYKAIDLTAQTCEDSAVPHFYQITTPYHAVLVAHLDKDRPLSEPKWVKTGDVQEWLRSMFGRMFWVAGDAAEGWEKKIEVVDPDPPPTIFTVLEAWATNSSVGVQIERQRFLRTHMTETDNVLEILLRLVRGERATYNQSAPPISAPSVSGPLLSALSPGSAHGAQQTHVSLSVLAIFRLAVEFAKKAVGDPGKAEVEERVGEIIRSLPTHLIYKSLDGIFKEWKVEKKGGR